jgi:hypothetical protein
VFVHADAIKTHEHFFNFDDMDFMLSQVAENMTDDILNNDLDLMLSQVAEEMENEYKCEQDLNHVTDCWRM